MILSPPTLEDQIEIRDNSSLHHYRTEIPNIIFRMNLDPWEFKAYCVLKSTAGDNGKCFKTNLTLASEIGCSLRHFISLKNSLVSLRLIKIKKQIHKNGGSMPDLITIIDVWPQNYEYMSKLFPRDRENDIKGFEFHHEGGGARESQGGVHGNQEGGAHGSHKQEQKEEEKKQQQNKGVVPAALAAAPANAAPQFACLEHSRCDDLSPKDKAAIRADCIKLRKTDEELETSLDFAYVPGKSINCRVAYIRQSLKKGYKRADKEKPCVPSDDTEREQESGSKCAEQVMENKCYAQQYHGQQNGRGISIIAHDFDVSFVPDDPHCPPKTMRYNEKYFVEEFKKVAEMFGFVII